MPAFVAMSRFRVRNAMEDAVAAAFLARRHLVDGADGFVRMDVLRGSDDPAEFCLLTFWRDEESYVRWHKSHAYHESHDGIPHGLKLDPAYTKVQTFTYVGS